MRNRRVWGVAATLALALAAPAARGGGGGPPPQGLLGRVFGGPANGEAQGTWASDEPRPNAESTRPQAEPPQNAIRKAREDYLRRQKVVDRLVEIALQTNDSALEKKARALEERAFAVYMKAVGPRGAPAGSEPEGPPSKGSAPRREEP